MTIEVSHAERVIFPDDGITKGDVVEHYQRVGQRMIELVADRPLTLQRFPKGIAVKGFMQKNAADHFPESIRRFEVPKADGGVTTYPVVDRAEDLAYLANQGTLTFHMWASSVSAPDHPDWLILDLDPTPGDLDGVRRVTFAVRDVLDDAGLTGSVLATGSSGFHVWVRLDRSSTTEETVEAARALAGLVALRVPDLATTEFLKKDRSGRVFVDWLRNNPTATTVVPFSLRPKPAAPVAVPVRWDGLESARPDGWSMHTLGDRLDLTFGTSPQRLPVAAIVATAREAGVDLDTSQDRFGRRSRRT
ncbi:MAG: non-homologous end-joining DNA ligase [Acidimicrobiales bacterium]